MLNLDHAENRPAPLVWESCPDVPPPFGANGAHLWNIPPALKFSEYLAPAEQSRLLRIHSEKTKRDYVTSQGGLRHVLSRYLPHLPQEIPMRRAEGGKPYVDRGPKFNLSHTEGMTIAVFARQEVGIDLEKADRRVNARNISQKFFTPDEIRMLDILSGEARRLSFLRLWVCKEAMVKLSGEGIAFGLRKVAVDLISFETPIGLYEGKMVHLWEFQPAPGYLGAVASWEPCRANCFYRL